MDSIISLCKVAPKRILARSTVARTAVAALATLAVTACSAPGAPSAESEQRTVAPLGAAISPAATLLLDDSIEGDLFGGPVALDGDTAAVHSSAYDGSVSVFVRTGGTWLLQQRLVVSGGEGSLGHSLALDGDTIVAGTGAETAYVFQRSGTTWTLTQKLVPPSADPSADGFGDALAIDGDTILVGEKNADSSEYVDAGAVHVFARSGETWSLSQTVFGNGMYANFGRAIAVDGEQAAVSGYFVDGETGKDENVVTTLSRTGTTWTRNQRLPHSSVFQDDFGYALALEGGTLAVGTPSEKNFMGAVYVFGQSNGTWTEHAKLVASDIAAYDDFGSAIAVHGNTIVVGLSPGHEPNRAYSFRRENATWTEHGTLIPSGEPRYYFGAFVAVSGATILVGGASGQGAGAAFVY